MAAEPIEIAGHDGGTATAVYRMTRRKRFVPRVIDKDDETLISDGQRV
ncbi:MAG TPA: hypothetical protein VG270_07990 [Pseudolabrys sp.]|jgi:hypothetical protein|nr:hypothetical protein [Pseudolabrys sp.]